MSNYSNSEKKYFLENCEKLTIEEMAREVGKKPKSLAVWLKAQGMKVTWGDRENEGLSMFSEKLAIKEELRASPVWKRLNQKFNTDEVAYFEDRYVAFVSQFKDDVVATEENQIHKLITYDVLMDRNLIQRKKVLKDIDLMEQEQKSIMREIAGDIKLLDDKQREKLEVLQRDIVLYREQDRSMTKEYTDLESSHQTIMKALKGTRDQRISKIESSKISFIGLLKQLQEEDVRNHEGLNAVLMDEATKKEFVRLATPHKYMDGNEDQPILSAETIDFLEELHKESEAK